MLIDTRALYFTKFFVVTLTGDAFLCENYRDRIRHIRHARITPLSINPIANARPPMNDPPSTRNTPHPTREPQTANMTSPDKVLVYHHRHNASNAIIPNGLAVIATSELEDILQTRKSPIPQYSLTISKASRANKLFPHRSRVAAQLQAHHPRLSQLSNLRARPLDRSPEAAVREHAELHDECGWCDGAVQGVLGEIGGVEGVQ
jgi:hypothetical protein